MAKKAKHLIWVLMFTICVLSIILAILPPPLNLSKIPQTRIEIKLCYSMIAKLEADQHKSIEDIIDSQETVGCLNRDLTRLIERERMRLDPNETRWSRYIDNSSMLVDAWKRPLQIQWREKLVGQNYNILKANVDASVIIWSLGPNGINDFGIGDDVVLERSLNPSRRP